MSPTVAPPDSRPVKVGLVSDVECVRTKSSADSISNGAPASGRVAVAIFPSGSPVLKKKGVSAATGVTHRQPSSGIVKRALVIDIAFLPATRLILPRINHRWVEMSVR